MSAELRTGIRHALDGATVVTAVGQIDLSTAERFRQALADTAGDHGRLIVDLSGVDYLDSAGVAVLFSRAIGDGMEIVVGDNRLVASILDICGIAELAPITPLSL